MGHVKPYLPPVIARLQVKYGVAALTEECDEAWLPIKRELISQFIVPEIVRRVDESALHEYRYRRSTAYTVTLDQILRLYTELFSVEYRQLHQNAALRDLDQKERLQLQKVIQTLRTCERHLIERLPPVPGPLDYTRTSKYERAFTFDDVNEVLEALYGAGLNKRANEFFSWDVVASLAGETILAKRLILFFLPIDSATSRSEREVHGLVEKLRLNERYSQTDLHSNIMALIEKKKRNPSFRFDQMSTLPFHVIHSSVVDTHSFRDAELCKLILQEDYYGSQILVPHANSYARMMIQRFMILSNEVDMLEFNKNRLVLVRDHMHKKARRTIMMPMLHLYSPYEFHCALQWLVKNRQSIARIYITGCIDILSATRGQAFIDLLRQLDIEGTNRLIWDYDRAMPSFYSLIERFWVQRTVEACDEPETVAAFLPHFSRMTLTLCNRRRDLCYIKNCQALCQLLSGVITQLGVKPRSKGATGKKETEYRFPPFNSLIFHINTNNPATHTKLMNAMRQLLDVGQSRVSIVFEPPCAGCAVQTNQYGDATEGLYDEKNALNLCRHLYIIAMEDVVRLNRPDLFMLFSMSDNLIVLDQPLAGIQSYYQQQPPQIHSQHIEPAPAWRYAPEEIKSLITDRFKSERRGMCRYSRESYLTENKRNRERSNIYDSEDEGIEREELGPPV